MTPFEVYCLYCALKLHFSTDSYDCNKYNYKTKTGTVKAFDARNDKYFFEKINRKYPDPKNFLISHLVIEPASPLVTITNSSSTVYVEWQKRKESLTYMFRNELGCLGESFDENFKIGDGHPALLKQYLGKKISPETISILLDITKIVPYWDKKMESDPIWRQYRNRVVKYIPFLEYDREAYKKIIVDKFR